MNNVTNATNENERREGGIEMLDDILRENPWRDVADKWRELLLKRRFPRSEFVLPIDSKIVELENKITKDLDCKLRLDLPPQPFIGNPKAKIWLLQYNPGYSGVVDEYDLLGKACDARFKRKLMPNRDFEDRVNLVVNQYSFADAEFYALNEKFHTFKTGMRGQGRGIYLWYRSLLFPSKDGLFSHLKACEQKSFLDENLFALEYMPYHSKSFDASCFAFLPSFEFWQKLINFAFESDKILIVNGINSRGGCFLKNMDGYKKALDEKRIYEIKRSGKGRSRMQLVKNKTIRYDGPLKDFIENMKNKVEKSAQR